MAHTYDTKIQISSSSNPATGSITCGTGATLVVLTMCYAPTSTRTGTPTLAGANFIDLPRSLNPQQYVTSPEAACEMWYFLAPTTGSALSVSIPNPNGLTLDVCVSSYIAGTGMQSVLSVSDAVSASGSNPALSLTTISDGCAIIGVLGHGYTNPATGRTGTPLYETDMGTWFSGHQYILQANAGAQSVGWTISTDDYGLIAAAFAEVPTGVNVKKSNITLLYGPKKGVNLVKANNILIYRAHFPGVNVSKANVIFIYKAAPAEGGADWWPFWLRYFSES